MLDRSGRRVFYDSNVILYGVSTDAERVLRVRDLLALRGTVSVQVLNELVNVGRRRMAMSWDEIDEMIRPLRSSLEIVPVTETTHELGVKLARRHRLAVYDGMIVAAALLADCDVLYSEDLHSGLLVDGRLRIVNPFRR
jgi:predicted nucleic acid-binding protein